jgi:transposase
LSTFIVAYLLRLEYQKRQGLLYTHPRHAVAEGRSLAQKRGQRMGRPSKLTAAQQAEARRRRAQGATLAELARSYHVGKSTISRPTG